MRFTAKRLFGAGVIGIAAIVAPIALTTVLPALSGGPGTAFAAPAGSCPASMTNDVICYNQSTGSNGTFSSYTPSSGGNGTGSQTSVGLTSGGGCATTKWTAATLIDFAGQVYGNNSYTGTPTSAPVDASSRKTGTCGLNGTGTNPWSIDDPGNGQSGAEALDFFIGNNPAMGSSRLIAEAQILLNNVAGINPTTVTLVETAPGNPTVWSQTCTLGLGTTTVDTSGNGNGSPCVQNQATTPSAFSQVEIQVPTAGAQVDVVGPTSTFVLANVICGGHSITAQDNPNNPNNPTGVVALLYMSGTSSQCKTYTAFTSSFDANNNNLPTVGFNGFSSTSVPFTVQITWPAVPMCSPYVDPKVTDEPASPPYAGVVGGVAGDQCPIHAFSFLGTTYYDQAYCQSALAHGIAVEAQQELCTVTKSYNNDIVADNYNADGSLKSITTTPIMTPGTAGAATTVNAADDTQDVATTCTGASSLTTNSSNLATAGFAASGYVSVVTSSGNAILRYNGLTEANGASTFNNCQVIRGAGTLATNNAITAPLPGTQVVETWIGNTDNYWH